MEVRGDLPQGGGNIWQEADTWRSDLRAVNNPSISGFKTIY